MHNRPTPRPGVYIRCGTGTRAYIVYKYTKEIQSVEEEEEEEEEKKKTTKKKKKKRKSLRVYIYIYIYEGTRDGDNIILCIRVVYNIV